ncbi:MAG: Fe-S cluster assembly ATPase SufC [Candidatus Terrybacteria bacterium]|nr:Fe-S cluster assembly ATPase SufC [Candidatus Terrybacteria bacterium]
MLTIQNLHVAAGTREILGGVSLRIRPQELHVLMGPNGSGKSTLAQVIAGNPRFTVTQGTLRFRRFDLLRRSPEARARLGVFVSFQQPLAIPGVGVADFLRLAIAERNGDRMRPSQLRERAAARLPDVGLPLATLDRELNVGFSGGEQKRMELAQLLLMGAKVAILDEVDSGLDIDGFRQVIRTVEEVRASGTAVLFITHNPGVIAHLMPTAVHVLIAGAIAASGAKALGEKIAQQGYRDIA